MKTLLIIIGLVVAGFVGYVVSEKKHEQQAALPESSTREVAELPAQRPQLPDMFSSPDSTHPQGMPWDYFPTATNKRWVYNITIHSKEIDPLHHRVSVWPTVGDKASMVEMRGILRTSDTADGRRQLILRVIGPSNRQGSLSYAEGYEIAVERDDLNIYEGADKVFWAVRHSRGYCVEEVRVLKPGGIGSPSRYGPWGSQDSKPGEEQRFMFFGEKPGMQLSIVGRNDALLYVGPQTVNRQPTLYFRRIITKGNPENRPLSHLDAGYEEHLWFKKGVGLVKLEQNVNGVKTMTWILQEPGNSF